MLVTRKQIKDHIIDEIIDFILENRDDDYFDNAAFTLDVSNYRRIIDSNTGKVKSSNQTGGRTVIYQEDFQQLSTDVDEYVNGLANCYCTAFKGDGITCQEGRYEIPDSYTSESDSEVNVGMNDSWWINSYGFSTDSNGELTGDDWGQAIIQSDHVCSDGIGTYTAGLILNENTLTYLSQLIPLDLTTSEFDSGLAKEILDTHIHELLPTGITRQERIDRFFAEFQALVGDIPEFDTNVDEDPTEDTWIDLESGQRQYHEENDISYVDNLKSGNIVRLNKDSGSLNQNQTLESLRNTINAHLTDVDKVVAPAPEDERPEYENVGPGYIQFRGLNQSIIIRKENDNDIGLIGPDPDNPLYLQNGFTIAMWVKFLDKTDGGTLFNFGAPMREENPFGFMLETFVINKNDSYKDPLTGDTRTWGDYVNQSGFSDSFFTTSDYERFIRLVVRDGDGILRDSHAGASFGVEGYTIPRVCTGEFTDINGVDCSNITIPHAYQAMIGNPIFEGHDFESYEEKSVLTHQRIPHNRNEWYFIVANYNPSITEYVRDGNGSECLSSGIECAPTGINDLSMFSDYWKWNVSYGDADGCSGTQPSDEAINSNGSLDLGTDTQLCGQSVQYKYIGAYTGNSGEGAKCKVEVISKSQLLRARGYKT